MAEADNKFQSIYGDVEDEFEIEDVSDETLSMPQEEIRAAVRKEEAAAVDEAVAEEAGHHGAAAASDTDGGESENAQPVKDALPDTAEALREGEDASREATAEPFPEGEAEPYSQEELDGITFEETVRLTEEPSDTGRSRAERDAHPERAGEAAPREDGAADDDTNDDAVSVLSYLGHAILFTIPLLGTILMLIYIISTRKNPHLRHFAQIWLVTLLVIMAGLCAAVVILGLA